MLVMSSCDRFSLESMIVVATTPKNSTLISATVQPS